MAEKEIRTRKRRSEIRLVENESQKMVTFCKRRKGLFSKAQEYSKLTGSEVAVLVFSPAGNPFVHGSPSFDSVIESYVNGNGGRCNFNVWEAVVGLENKAAAAQSIEELTVVKKDLEEVRQALLKKLKDLEEDEFVCSLLNC